MRFLPKVNPLFEKSSASTVSIPDFFEKLHTSSFTGYVYHSALKFEFYGVLAIGKLLCAYCCDGAREKSGFEALALLCDTVILTGGDIIAYCMSTDLAVSAHAQIVGKRLFSGEEVRQIDIKGVLARLKSQGVNGVVRFYTTERSAMMFYKDGVPIGFYYDAADSLESSPDESRIIAALPGARVEICTTRTLEELLQYDLLQMVNLSKLWEAARARDAAVRPNMVGTSEPPGAVPDDQKLLDLIDDISEVASAYLSREGRIIVEKRVRELGGPLILLDHDKCSRLIAHIEADALEINSYARIDEMIDLMRSEISSRLAV
ncbi:MAG TPA: GTPase-activating protein [Desulfuromonadales bacterium]|nr:GTPase-activating protein [Desulfuromonadales bacterium]